MLDLVQSSRSKCVVLVGPALTLSVLSADPQLIALCRDILRELGAPSRELSGASDGAAAGNPKVYLWDYESGEAPPAREQSDSGETFYLVPPQNVESFLQRTPSAQGHILLKPVTPAILRTFLRLVAPVRESAQFSTVGRLRANRDDLLQRLLQANLRLQEYDRQRTNFIARAVHDFRAPLTALSGFCGLLASGQLGFINNEQKEAMNRMGHSARRLSRMASAMFELTIGARVDRKPDLRENDICDRIKQALHEILPLALEKEISLHAREITPPDQPLCFDSSQMEQVLLNLLDNACKFTHPGGRIEVRGYPDFWERRFLVAGTAPRERRVASVRSSNCYRIDIKDTGPGIHPDRLRHLFEENTSYSGPQDRSGGGLGLAICRLILSRHEGRIWVASHQDGTVFSIALPYRREEALPEASISVSA